MKLLIAGGGTGGHVFPALAIAQEWLARGNEREVVLVGTERGIEMKLVPQAGLPLETLRVAGLKGKGGATLCQLDGDGGHRWRGTMLDRQREIIAVAAQVEVGIAPGVELRGAAQRLTGADAATALLGVMDDEHGNVMLALQLAQVGEQRGDLAAGVFVDAVETYERIEDEQARLQSGDGLGEVAAVGIQIEPDGGRGDAA